MSAVRSRLVKDQAGFTLAEMMVMLVVFFALYSIFDTSLEVFRFGNDKVEAVENARLGMEKMEREIRAAYPVKGPTSTGADRYRFFTADGTKTNVSPSPAPTAAMPTSTQITFGNELGSGNGAIQCGNPCEYITYKLVGSTLMRNNTSTGSTSNTGDQPVVEFVKSDGLRFRYFSGTTCNGTVSVGTEITPSSPPGSCTQADIGRVEITLQIAKDKGTQTLTTEVDLRNPGSIQ